MVSVISTSRRGGGGFEVWGVGFRVSAETPTFLGLRVSGASLCESGFLPGLRVYDSRLPADKVRA